MSDTVAAAAAGEANPPSPKRVKSQPPDVVVAVGQGDSKVEFECYGTLLSFASEVFDTMLSTNMKEKETHRIELPHKKPQEWEIFYDFIENRNATVEARKRSRVRSSIILSETKERARLLLPWFHEFQMSALVEECDDAFQKELLSFKQDSYYCSDSYLKKFWSRGDEYQKSRKEMFQLCYELLSMSYVYDLPKTQNHVAKTLCLAVEFGYDLFNIDDLKNIIPLLKNRRNDKSRSLLFFELCEYLPDELAKKSEICLAENDDMLPFLIHAGMREKSVKNELEEVQKDAKQELEGVQRDFNVVKEELQEAIDRLPSSLFNNLPNTKKCQPTARTGLTLRQNGNCSESFTGGGEERVVVFVTQFKSLPATTTDDIVPLSLHQCLSYHRHETYFFILAFRLCRHNSSALVVLCHVF